ncbi:hypothetical protein HanRHA438_Chr12g0555411 [Helianthus annuus]|nr:hypothetical protein HanRHA438_Chr12g0555411 [Helianthus annuus]
MVQKCENALVFYGLCNNRSTKPKIKSVIKIHHTESSRIFEVLKSRYITIGSAL